MRQSTPGSCRRGRKKLEPDPMTGCRAPSPYTTGRIKKPLVYHRQDEGFSGFVFTRLERAR